MFAVLLDISLKKPLARHRYQCSALYRADSIRLVLLHVILRENEQLGPGPKITRKPASHAPVWFGMRDTSPGQPAGRSRVVYTQNEIDGVIIYS